MMITRGTACRLTFFCRDIADLTTPETGEAGGQPQISINGAAYEDTTNVLVAIGSGDYYVELTTDETDIAPGSVIIGRYASANTTEIKSKQTVVIAPAVAAFPSVPTAMDTAKLVLALLEDAC